MNKVFKVDVQLEKVAGTADLYNGILYLTVTEQIVIDKIDLSFLQTVKGKMSDEETVLKHISIGKGRDRLVESGAYEYPFQISKTSSVDTYKGVNASILYEIEVNIEVKKEHAKQAKSGLLKKLTTLVTGKHVFTSSKFFEFYEEEITYKVINNSDYLKLKRNNLAMLILSIMWIAIYLLFATFSMKSGFWAGIIGAIGLGYLTQRLLLNVVIGKMNAKIVAQEEAGFLSIIESEVNWLFLSDASIHYEIIEEVIDRRGTTDSTYRATLFSSEPKKVRLSDGPKQVTHDFPNLPKKIPIIDVEDISIKWELVVEVTTVFGLDLLYRRVFKGADGY